MNSEDTFEIILKEISQPKKTKKELKYLKM